MKSICINILLQNTINVTTTTIADMRNYIMSAIPTAKITWCPDNNFIFPWNKNSENSLIASYLLLGDELAIWDWFPVINYPTLPLFEWHINEWFANALTRYWRWTKVACWWYFPASYLEYLVTKWIEIANATVWSQTWVDRFQWEWTRLFPYYPSSENASVPWILNIVSCNSLSADPLGCRVLSWDSRWTLHPADPLTSWLSQIHILWQSLLNKEYPLFVYLEVDWLYSWAWLLSNNWKTTVDFLKTTDIQVISMLDYNSYHRKNYKDNNQCRWMVFTWSWITYWNSSSPSNKKQYWYEDWDFSVCIEHNLSTWIKTVESCVHYVDGIPESYWKFLYWWTPYSDYSYTNWKSYKFDSFSANNSRERRLGVLRALDYFKISLS